MKLLQTTFINTDKRFLFVLICLFASLLTYISQAFFITEELFYNSLSEQVAIERFEKLWAESVGLGYLFVPILLTWKKYRAGIENISPSPILSDTCALCLLL